MRHLSITLAAAAAAFAASAAITDTQLFETSFDDFVADGEHSSSIKAYADDAPGIDAPYPCESFGSNYLSLDMGDAALWRTNTAVGNVYFDMAMKLAVSPSEPETPDTGVKLEVYQNSDSNVVVLAGVSASDRTATNYVTTTTVEPGTWVRVTVSAEVVDSALAFSVRINGTLVQTADGQTTFPCLTDDTTVRNVGFSGSGALDDYVVRTTDPYFSGTAVACIGTGDDCEKYATFEEARADAGDAAITLLADASATVAANETLKVKAGGYTFTATAADGYALSQSTDEDGVTTYTTAEGVAKLNDTWYSSFEAAYADATSTADTMFIKISGDFEPVLDGSRTFASVTFTNTDDTVESIAIATRYNDYTFKATRWNFPSNATLSLSGSYTVADAVGGIINIPSGEKIEISGTSTFAAIMGITGAGELIAPATPTYFITGSKVITGKMLTNELWTGTFELRGNYGTGAITLSDMANNNSTIRFNGFTAGAIGANNATYGMDIALAGSGLTVGGDYTRDQIYLSGAVSGSGTLNIAAAQAKILRLNFTGDASGFTGDIINTNSYARIVFGGTSGAGGGSISVVNGASVTNASTATWIANDVVLINGELVANGTMTVSGSLWGANGDGVYRANATTADINSFGSSWNGTYVIGYSPSDAFNPNNFGNANSTVALAADLATGAYFGTGSKEALTVAPTVRLDCDVTIKNGYSDAANTYAVTFNKLTGSGKLTTSSSGYTTTWRWYAINTLADFTGSIEVPSGSRLSIATVDLDAAPEADVVVIPATADGTIEGDFAVTVNGEATTYTLEYKTVGEVSGLYLKSAVVVPTVEPGATIEVEAASAEAAAAAVEVAVPAAVSDAGVDGDTYKALFATKATYNEETGKYTVTADMSDATTNDVQTAVDAASAATLTAVKAVAAETAASVTVTTKPGLYYQIVTGTSLPVGEPTSEGWTMATAETTVINVTKPSGTKAFFKVYCSAINE